jgi:hypothetical protein
MSFTTRQNKSIFDFKSKEILEHSMKLSKGAEQDVKEFYGIKIGEPAKNPDAFTKSIKLSEEAGNGSVPSFQMLVASNLKEALDELSNLRKSGDNKLAKDVSYVDYFHKRWGLAFDEEKLKAGDSTTIRTPTALFDLLGVDTRSHTVDSFYSNTGNFPTTGMAWLIGEMILEAMRTGMRKAPIYDSLIRTSMPVSRKNVTIPEIKMSDASVYKINEATDIPLGSVSVGENRVSISEYGIGFKMTDAAIREANINLMQIFISDLGVKLQQAITNNAIQTLMTGNNGANAAKVVGVTTIGTITYRDWLRVMLRMSLLGYGPGESLGRENVLLDLLTMPEVQGYAGQTTKMNIEVVTPMPSRQRFHPNYAITSEDQILLVDALSALIKLDLEPLRIESSRIVEKRTELQVATISTGFSTLFNEARLILDKSVDFDVAGWDASLSPSAPDLVAYRTV